MNSKPYPCIRCTTPTVLTCAGCNRALCDLCQEDEPLCSVCSGNSDQDLSIAVHVLSWA